MVIYGDHDRFLAYDPIEHPVCRSNEGGVSVAGSTTVGVGLVNGGRFGLTLCDKGLDGRLRLANNGLANSAPGSRLLTIDDSYLRMSQCPQPANSCHSSQVGRIHARSCRTGRFHPIPVRKPGVEPPTVFAIATGRRGSWLFVRQRPALAGREWTDLMHWDAILERHPSGGWAVLERRKPRLLLRFDSSFLLRYAERQLSASLFQEPPRITRLEPVSRQPSTMLAPVTRDRKR